MIHVDPYKNKVMYNNFPVADILIDKHWGCSVHFCNTELAPIIEEHLLKDFKYIVNDTQPALCAELGWTVVSVVEPVTCIKSRLGKNKKCVMLN